METFTLVVDIITAFGVIVALFSLSVSMRSAYLSTIAKCTDEFRELVRKEQILCEMQSQHPDTDAHLLILKRDFLGLFKRTIILYTKGLRPERYQYGMAGYNDPIYVCETPQRSCRINH